MRHLIRGLTALGLALGIPAVGQAGFISTPIDVPGASVTGATGLNDVGQIVGFFGQEATRIHGFLLSSGTFTTVDVPGATATLPFDINDAGQIGGAFADATGVLHGFVWSNGTFTSIDVPGASSTTVTGINDAGQIVGDFLDPGGSRDTNVGRHGFLLSGGTFTTVDVAGADITVAVDINTAGQTVGNFGTFAEGLSHGFLLDGGSFTRFDVPGASQPPLDTVVSDPGTQAFSINDTGQIAGHFTDAAGLHGYVLDGGRFTRFDVDLPGAIGTQVAEINDQGQLVGLVDDAAGGAHGYLATPVAGPASLLLVSLGAISLAAYGQRRRRPGPHIPCGRAV
jgi:probable HAF family extracellular repeat protein